MPLYEIVLDWGNDQEVRLTDHAPALGDVIELHGMHWEIVDKLDASDEGNVRFEARPVREEATTR